MILGVDYSFDRPNLQWLWDMGYRVIVRYLTDQEGSAGMKCLTLAERDAIWAMGFDISLVWETTKGRPLVGYEAGVQDAKTACDLAAQLDFPRDKLIWVAYDQNFAAQAVVEYARGWSDERRAVGGYGSAKLLDWLWDNGLIKAQWQAGANAWSDYKLAQHVSMVQRVPVQVTDINTIDETHPTTKTWLWSKPLKLIPEPARNKIEEARAILDKAAALLGADPLAFSFLWDASAALAMVEQERK